MLNVQSETYFRSHSCFNSSSIQHICEGISVSCIKLSISTKVITFAVGGIKLPLTQRSDKE